MKDAEFINGSLACLAISIAFAVGFWVILQSVQAIIKREYRNPKSGEILTGARAVWAGLIRVVLFCVFMILFVIVLLNSQQ